MARLKWRKVYQSQSEERVFRAVTLLSYAMFDYEGHSDNKGQVFLRCGKAAANRAQRILRQNGFM